MANNNSGRDKNEKDLVCSFCGKHQDEVERMIIGPGVNTSATDASTTKARVCISSPCNGTERKRCSIAR